MDLIIFTHLMIYVLLFYQLMSIVKKNDQMTIYQQMYKRLSQSNKTSPTMLDLKVVENKYLELNSTYNFLYLKLKQYNKKVQIAADLIDSYQVQTINSLYQILRDITNMQKIVDQQKQLNHTKLWYQQQQRLITNRQSQGTTRYKILCRRLSLPSSPIKVEQNKSKWNLPSDYLRQAMLPYYLKNRTTHEESQIPSQKIKQYKKKVLNIQPTIQFKTSQKSSRLKFPKPMRLIRQIPPENKQQQPKEVDPNAPLQQPQSAVPGSPGLPQQQKGGQQIGIGEQPEEPDEAQQVPEENKQDKLAPKQKIYSKAYKGQNNLRKNDIETRDLYINNLGDQSKIQRNFDQKYRKIQNEQAIQIKQDEQKIKILNAWSKNYSRLNKQLQKRVEDLSIEPNYQYIYQQKPVPFYFNEEEQKKFNFIDKNAKKLLVKSQVDFSTTLPRLAQIRTKENISNNYQKGVDHSRLDKLKRRFSHMLGLAPDVQQRQLPKSLCQYSHRFKAFSSILDQHSVDKQRSLQMQEIREIKQKLTKNKVGLNVTTLAQGLCLPDSTFYQQIGYPMADLPKNPFFVDKKKKKKKK